MSGVGVTASLNVIGTGRVLNHRELVGRSLCYFLSVSFAGRTFRWSSPSGRDLWESAVDGDQLHFQGMDSPQLSQSFDFESDSPVDVSVSFEDLTFPGDVNLPELLAQGHRLEKCEAEVSVLPDDPDALWSERYIILNGTVTEPVYGDPETHANTAAFSVDSPAWEDSALFPPDDWVVDTETWTTADDEAIGRVFPFVFGSPGVYTVSDGTSTYVRQGTPALHIGGNIVMIAGHLVADDFYDTGTFNTLTLRGSSMGDVNPANQDIWTNTGSGIITNGITSGFKFTAVDLFDWDGMGSNVPPGEDIWVRGWAELFGVAQEGFRRGEGGYPDFGGSSPLRTAGDVLYFMLLQSSLKVDRGRAAVAQSLLQGLILGGYIDERVTPYEWVTDNLLTILPISMSQGPKGIFPIVWRYDAGPTDCVGSFIEGPRWRRVSGVERDESGIFNEYTLNYAVDGSSYKQKFGISGALTKPSDGTTRTSMVVPNLYARRSVLEHGLISQEDSSDIVWSRETAAQICAWKIRANALAKRFVTYEATAEHAWLEPGDPIMVTDPDLFFDEQVCLVRTKTWDITSVLYELMILTDPVRDVVAVEADTSPIIYWDFETVGEGSGGTNTFVNQGSYAVTASIDGGNCTRTTADFVEGAASCRISTASSFGFSLAGDTALNIDNTDGATIEFWFKPNTVSGLALLFDWGDTNPTRGGIYIDSGEPKAYVGHSSSYSFITSGGFTVTNLTWAFWKLQLIPSGTSRLYIDGVVKGTGTLPGPWTVAELGHAVRWGRSAFTAANHMDGWLESFKIRRGIH